MAQAVPRHLFGGDDGGDGGFEDYEESSMDPGNSMLIATLIFCVLLIAFLPCVVAVGRRFQRHEAIIVSDTTTTNGEEDARACCDTRTDSGSSHKSKGGLQEHERKHKKLKTKSSDLYSRRSSESGHDDNDDDNSSAASAASIVSGVGSVASALVNAILDTAPHGDVWKRKANVNMYAHNDNRGEIEIQESNHDGDAMSVDHSILSKISHDEVSITDAVDSPESINPSKGSGAAGAAGAAAGRGGGSCASRIQRGYHDLLAIAEWDYETRRICKLMGPFIVQGLMEGVVETVRVAIVGRLIGTRALSAYVTVDLVVGLTTSFLRGFQHACTTLCSHAVGAGNRKLAGQYIQIATIMYAICYIPIFLFWMLYIGDLFTWFGFDDETRKIGEEFTLLFLFKSFLEGVHNSAHALLDVIGKENYSTLFIACQNFVSVGLVVAVALQPETETLELVGLAYIAVEALGLVVDTAIIVANGWFDRYLEGLVGTFAFLNTAATKLLLGTSISLSFGELLAYGEWELLTVFASILGPAEIAAWGLLGTLWDALELVTEAVADAGEVRTAFLLGAGQPEKAKISSYKSIYLAIFVSVFLSSILFIGGEDIPTWLTTDSTLQRLTTELMPLFGIGNIALTIGTMSWTLVGAQGRYRLATAVGFSGSWFVSIPLSAILTIALNMNLQGQTAAVVIGYMVSGSLNSYILLQSDWPKLSRRVMAQAAAARPADDDDSSSSGSSSSSSSSSNALGLTGRSNNRDDLVESGGFVNSSLDGAEETAPRMNDTSSVGSFMTASQQDSRTGSPSTEKEGQIAYFPESFTTTFDNMTKSISDMLPTSPLSTSPSPPKVYTRSASSPPQGASSGMKSSNSFSRSHSSELPRGSLN